MAIDELQESMEEANIPITNNVDVTLVLPIGDTEITSLPTDLVEIQDLLERDTGANDWIPMRKVTFIPENIRAGNSLTYWSWQRQTLQFIGALGNKELKMNYIAKVQASVTDENDQINIINAKSFLSYRNASLCAEFIGENKTRADSLNQYAVLAIQRMLGINVKGQQGMPVRRRPFMSGYKSRR
jgi:hypothetical protein